MTFVQKTCAFNIDEIDTLTTKYAISEKNILFGKFKTVTTDSVISVALFHPLLLLMSWIFFRFLFEPEDMDCSAAVFFCVIMSRLEACCKTSSNVSNGFASVGLVRLEIRLPLYAGNYIKTKFFFQVKVTLSGKYEKQDIYWKLCQYQMVKRPK